MLNKKRKIILLFLGGILLVTILSVCIVKIKGQIQLENQKAILAEADANLTAINDDISVDLENKTILAVYPDGGKDEYSQSDLDDYGDIEVNTLYGITANGQNVVIDASDVDDFALFEFGAYEFCDGALIYQDEDRLMHKDLGTNKTRTLQKLTGFNGMEDFSFNDKYTLLSVVEYRESDTITEQVLYLYDNKTNKRSEIYRDSYETGMNLLAVNLYGESVYYNGYTPGRNGDSYPLYKYDIKNGKTTKIYENGNMMNQHQDKLLLYIDGEGGVLNMDTGKLEASFPLPSYNDMVPALTLYEDKIIYYMEPTAELIEYDYKNNRSSVLYKFPLDMGDSGYLEGTNLCYVTMDRITTINDNLRVDISLHGVRTTFDYPGHQGEMMSAPYYIKQYHFLFDVENQKMKYIKQT